MNSKNKGKVGELEFAKVLEDAGFSARRGRQFSGSSDSPDVVHNVPGVHFEVKRTERLELHAAVAQATADAGKYLVPVVAYRRSRDKWLAILPMEAYLRLVKNKLELQAGRGDNGD